MTRTPVRLARAGVVLMSGLLLAVGIALAQPPAPAVSLVVVVAAGLLIAALGSRSTAVVTPRRLRIGSRDRGHEESLAERCAPAHPDTAGRVRARAPGTLAPAAGS